MERVLASMSPLRRLGGTRIGSAGSCRAIRHHDFRPARTGFGAAVILLARDSAPGGRARCARQGLGERSANEPLARPPQLHVAAEGFSARGVASGEFFSTLTGRTDFHVAHTVSFAEEMFCPVCCYYQETLFS